MESAESKKILVVVVKATSTLDYVTPLLWALKRRSPSSRITVLYCAFNQRRIVRDAGFFSDIFRKNSIEETNFAALLPRPFSLLSFMLRFLFANSDWDSRPLDLLFRRIPGLGGRNPVQSLFKRVERFLHRFVGVERIFNRVDPDLVIYDHRTGDALHVAERVRAVIDRRRIRTILLPHAPHHTSPNSFTPYAETGDPLPLHCEYWMPFLHDRFWEAIPEKRNQFRYVGYPGLDRGWNEYLNHAPSLRKERPLRCLFIIRKYLWEGERAPAGHDPYIFSYAEFASLLRNLKDAIQTAATPIELFIKPHPSNNFSKVLSDFISFGFPSVRICSDSIYAEISKVDFVVSIYSTTLLMATAARRPVILIDSRIQKESHQWAPMSDLYSGLSHFCRDTPAFQRAFGEIVTALSRGETPPGVEADLEHLRRFFPDNAAERAFESIFATPDRAS